MTHQFSAALIEDFRGAVAEDLACLALIQDSQPSKALLHKLRDMAFADSLGIRLRTEAGRMAQGQLRRALEDLPDSVDDDLRDVFAHDYALSFLPNRRQGAPTESNWLDSLDAAPNASEQRVHTFYRRHGLRVGDRRNRGEDHVVFQLQFLAHLIAGGDTDEDLREAARFLDEHPLRWYGRFAAATARRADTRFLASVVLLTNAYLEELRDLLALVLREPRPAAVEVEARIAETMATGPDLSRRATVSETGRA